MASVHQKQPVPKVAVSVAVSGVELAGVEPLFLLSEVEVLILLFLFLVELSFWAQELSPAKLMAEINKILNMGYFFITYAKLTSADCRTIVCNKSLTDG